MKRFKGKIAVFAIFVALSGAALAENQDLAQNQATSETPENFGEKFVRVSGELWKKFKTVISESQFTTSVERGFGFAHEISLDKKSQKQSMKFTHYGDFGLHFGGRYFIKNHHTIEVLAGFTSPEGFGTKISYYYFFNDFNGIFAGPKLSYLPRSLNLKFSDEDPKKLGQFGTGLQLGYAFSKQQDWMLKFGYDAGFFVKSSEKIRDFTIANRLFVETTIIFGK